MVEDTAALVSAFRAVRVPLERVLAQEFFHGVPANQLAVQLALTNAWAIAQNVSLVLRHAGAAEMHVTSGHIVGGGFAEVEIFAIRFDRRRKQICDE